MSHARTFSHHRLDVYRLAVQLAVQVRRICDRMPRGSGPLAEISERGVGRRLVAFELSAGGVPRQGYPVLAGETAVGQVTSGNVSPSLGTPIGMAYVPTRLTEPGTEIAIEIRGKAVPARVTTLPFYPHKTKKIASAPSTRA